MTCLKSSEIVYNSFLAQKVRMSLEEVMFTISGQAFTLE
ncbi:MAG: hypothetical protein ACI9V8_001055, partial [Urechidicola sp.]